MSSASDPHVDHVPEDGVPEGPRFPAAPRRALSVLAIAALALVYASWFGPWSDGQLIGNDAVHYAANVAAGDADGLLLANHLVPHLAARVLYAVGDGVGVLAPGLAGALAAQRIVSGLGGALAVALTFVLVRALTDSRRAATLAALVLATSSGLWLYASAGETYAPAAAAEAWVLFELWRARARPSGAPSNGGWLRVALALAVATLVREDAVLVAVAVAVVLGRRAALPLAVAGALSLALFALAFSWVERDVAFDDWLLGIAASDVWSTGAARPDPWLAMRVHGVLTLDALAFGVHRLDGWSSARLVASAAIAVHALALGAVWWRARGSRSRAFGVANGASARSRFAAGVGLYLVARFAFHAWFQPSNIEYAVGHLVPIVVLLALGWTRRASGPPRLAWAALVLQGVATALVVLPLRDARLDGDARALTELARTNAHPLVVVTVEPFGELAVERERYRVGDPSDPRVPRTSNDVPAIEPHLVRVDGSGGNDPERARAVAEQVAPELARGRDVAVTVDRRLAHLLGLPRTEVPMPLAQALVDLVDFETLTTSGALASYLLPGRARDADAIEDSTDDEKRP